MLISGEIMRSIMVSGLHDAICVALVTAFYRWRWRSRCSPKHTRSHPHSEAWINHAAE